MVNVTYNFQTFNDFKNAFEAFQSYFRENGWNPSPQCSDLHWNCDWLSGDTPYFQLKQNFDEYHRDCFEITVRKLTSHLSHEEALDAIAMKHNVVMIRDIDNVETKPYGMVQRLIADYCLKKRICVACGNEMECEYGHNPAPCTDYGRCCSHCNCQVIEIRMREAGMFTKMEFNVPEGKETDAEAVEGLKEVMKSDGFKFMISHLHAETLKGRGYEPELKNKKWA